MSTVIVGLNESEEAQDALRLAKALANAWDADIHVVAVLSFETLMVDPDEYERMRQRHFDRVFELAENELGGNYTPHRVDDISPPAALTNVAEETSADAVVIGSAHRGPIGRVLLGDVGQRLAHGAPCPVVVAPRGLGRRERVGFGQVGVGYDGTPESGTALAAAVELARQFGGSLRLIGVVPRFLTPGRIGGTDVGFSQLLRENLEKELEEAKSSIEGLEVETTVSVGDAADELATQGSELDLLVIGSRGYGPLRRVLLGGVSGKVMRSAPCPVVVVPRASSEGSAPRLEFAALARQEW